MSSNYLSRVPQGTVYEVTIPEGFNDTITVHMWGGGGGGGGANRITAPGNYGGGDGGGGFYVTGPISVTAGDVVTVAVGGGGQGGLRGQSDAGGGPGGYGLSGWQGGHGGNAGPVGASGGGGGGGGATVVLVNGVVVAVAPGGGGGGGGGTTAVGLNARLVSMPTVPAPSPTPTPTPTPTPEPAPSPVPVPVTPSPSPIPTVYDEFINIPSSGLTTDTFTGTISGGAPSSSFSWTWYKPDGSVYLGGPGTDSLDGSGNYSTSSLQCPIVGTWVVVVTFAATGNIRSDSIVISSPTSPVPTPTDSGESGETDTDVSDSGG